MRYKQIKKAVLGAAFAAGVALGAVSCAHQQVGEIKQNLAQRFMCKSSQVEMADFKPYSEEKDDKGRLRFLRIFSKTKKEGKFLQLELPGPFVEGIEKLDESEQWKMYQANMQVAVSSYPKDAQWDCNNPPKQDTELETENKTLDTEHPTPETPEPATDTAKPKRERIIKDEDAEQPKPEVKPEPAPAPQVAPPQKKVIVYYKSGCPRCRRAKKFLKRNKIPFEMRNVRKKEYMAEAVAIGTRLSSPNLPLISAGGKVSAGGKEFSGWSEQIAERVKAAMKKKQESGVEERVPDVQPEEKPPEPVRDVSGWKIPPKFLKNPALNGGKKYAPTQAGVNGMLKANQTWVRGIFERALKKDPSVGGKIEIVLTVGRGGAVTSMRMRGENLTDQMVQNYANLFGRSRWRVTGEVRFTFNLQANQ